jgi:hypothetical protein
MATTTGITNLYENILKERNPGQKEITYDLEELVSFLQGLADLSLLV